MKSTEDSKIMLSTEDVKLVYISTEDNKIIKSKLCYLRKIVKLVIYR